MKTNHNQPAKILAIALLVDDFNTYSFTKDWQTHQHMTIKVDGTDRWWFVDYMKFYYLNIGDDHNPLVIPESRS
jgi:heme/copper-type cytochrome/quinol oxidase subunit 2